VSFTLWPKDDLSEHGLLGKSLLAGSKSFRNAKSGEFYYYIGGQKTEEKLLESNHPTEEKYVEEKDLKMITKTPS
jgi:hypothetical protein